MCLLAAGCIDPSDDRGSEAAPIVGGSVDTGDPAVAYLSISTTAGGYACSGTLITPRVVLTAAHCLDGDGTTNAVEVYFGSTVVGTDSAFIERIDAETWGFFSGWDLSYGDVALVLLERNSQVTPRPINQTPLSSYVGQPYRMVGWGQTGGGGGAGTKRTVTTTLSGFSGNYVLRYGTASANTCQGDSGGPGFMTINGQEVVAGITSYGTGGDCYSTSGATHVYQFRGWIDDWIATNDVATPPTASFVRPAAGARLGPSFVAEVAADDNREVTRVELYVDGELNATVSSRPYVFNVNAAGDGPLTLQARAYDARGDFGTATVNVDIVSSCQGGETCPDGLDCIDGQCRPAEPGGLGEPCADGGDCSSGLCATSGDQQFCTESCDVAAADCPDQYVCEPAAAGGFCFPADGGGGGGDGSGCATGPGGRSPWTALLLVVAALMLTCRRRRRRCGRTACSSPTTAPDR